MTVHLGAVIGVLSAVVGYVALSAFGVATGVNEYVLAGVLFVVGLILHYVSPLPETNGGMGMGKPTMQQWGFTTDPKEDKK